MAAFITAVRIGLVFIGVALPASMRAEVKHFDLPDEYAANGSLGLALQNGGTAHFTGFEAIRLNPAMLALTKQYEITGVYHWPRYGGEFFQAGIVDSKTSPIAAGVAVTRQSDQIDLSAVADYPTSPVKQRVHFGFAQPVGKLSVGVGGQYVEGFAQAEGDAAPKMIKATTLSTGLAALVTPNIRVGLSGQNLTNKTVSHLAPKALQAGVSALLGGEKLVVNLDYVRRTRINGLEINGGAQYGVFALRGEPQPSADKLEGEVSKVIGSISAQVYDAFHLMAAYGRDTSVGQASMSGGLAVVSGSMRLVYSAARPNLAIETSHQSVIVNIALDL